MFLQVLSFVHVLQARVAKESPAMIEAQGTRRGLWKPRVFSSGFLSRDLCTCNDGRSRRALHKFFGLDFS